MISESGFNESHAKSSISVSSVSVRHQVCEVVPDSVSIHFLDVGTIVGPSGYHQENPKKINQA